MKLYAAVSGRAEPVVDRAYPHVLVSYALDPRLTILDAYTPESLLIDSGAFTVWTKGRTIDVDDYGAWCGEVGAAHDGKCDVAFVSLDVIPGDHGRKPTVDEVTAAAAASMTNADRLRSHHGLRVMEVYHYGEPVDVLDALLARRRPGETVGVGGSVGVPHNERTRWHDAVWAHVIAKHTTVNAVVGPGGRDARVDRETVVPPLHGLGASNEDLARRYPWYSVDSSTYTIPQRFGRTLNARGRQEFIRLPGEHVRDRRDQPPSDTLRRNKSAQAIEAGRILDRWRRLEASMTGAWERRGIRYAP